MGGIRLMQGKKRNAWEVARELIPNGTQTLSKAPDRYVNGVYPKMLKYGDGCHVEGDNGQVYNDFICGLGPIILGYNFGAVNQAVVETIRNGQVLLSLPHEKESQLAETLYNHVPIAKKSKFFKTGSEALSAAVKVARAYTGKEKVLVCGYHGWHDWYTIVNDKKAGIPKALEATVAKFKYNDLQSLKDHFDRDGDKIAAVILEPVIYEEPKDNFLEEVVRMAHAHEALVVFDEVVTGYRFGIGGAMSHFNVLPDLACFSKAMGNGFPIAALVGQADFMNVFERDDFFVSGTFGGDLIGISAAQATSRYLSDPRYAVKEKIWKLGERLKTGFNAICEALDLPDIKCVGYPCRTMFDFPSAAHKALFWQECLKNGTLFGYANFISYAHTSTVIEHAINCSETALREVKNNWADPKAVLEGDVPKEVFRLR